MEENEFEKLLKKIEEFVKSDEQNNDDKMKEIRLNLTSDNNLKKDIEMKIKEIENKLIEMSSQGYKTADYNLGKIYSECFNNYEKAIEYYEKAANKGCNESPAILGDYFYEGKVVKKDINKAIEWYNKAIDNGSEKVEEKILLNTYYPIFLLNENVSKEEIEKILELYAKLANKGDQHALLFLSEIYYCGQRVEKDYDKALEWYVKTAYQGDEYARYKVKELLEKKIVLEKEWDKTFPKSDIVNHKKIVFENKYGNTLVADMYKPKEYEGKLPAIAVCGPFGAVKEQCSGLYAQTMAERGFLTIAFDPSYTGESALYQNYPLYMAGPDINTEDFQAAVDFLSTCEEVDVDKIGIIGICGWGGIALNTATIDTRIKATVTSTMYDMSRLYANGYFDEENNEEARYQKKKMLNEQRTKDYKNRRYEKAGGCLELPVSEDLPFYVKDYSEYYKGRCYHTRSLNSNEGWNKIGCMSFINQPMLKYLHEIRSSVLMIHGEKAHSCYFSKDAYNDMIKDSKYASNKELYIIPNAVHTDLYDNLDVIPFDKIEKFFKNNFDCDNK